MISNNLNLLLLSNVVQVSAQELNAFDVVLLVELLVDGVSAVGGATHGQQQHILARGLLKGESDGDAAALASEVGLGAPDTLDGLAGGAKVPVVRARDPPFARVLGVHFERVLGAQLGECLAHKLVDALVGLVDVHVGHGADGELADHLSGDDGLGARSREGALDTVHRERRVSPTGHERGLLVLEYGRLGSKRLVEVVHSEADVVVQALLLGRHGRHLLHNAGDLNLAVRVHEASQHAH